MLRVSQYCSKLIVQNVERTLLLFSYLRFRFTAAYTIKISVLFSSSWSSMLQAVIHKDSRMRRRLCGKLHGGPSQLLFALHRSSIDSQLFVKNREFCLPHLHSTPPFCGSPSEYCHDAWYGKTDRRADTAWRHRPCLHSIPRQKCSDVILCSECD